MNTIIINGETYIKQNSTPNGKRAIIIVDRGWIFAGDVHESDGRIKLSRCVWVFRWERIGLDGVIKNPKADEATLKKIDDVDIPAGSEVFRIPVDGDWGL